MDNNQNNEKKKSNLALIIIIIIVILLLLFAVWFFLLRDKGEKNNSNNDNKIEEKTNNNDTPTPTNTGYEYDYRDGILTQIVDEEGKPKQTDFVIDGIILIGNRHNYFGRDDTTRIIEDFAKQGYKKEGINSSYYLNEYIEFYIDTKYMGLESDVKILVTPHKKVEEYEKMTFSELSDLASSGGFVLDYITPDADNYKYVGNNYVNEDYPEGKYDILFTYKGKLAYFIIITETKEPTE